jgi:hypothetical protein
MNREDIKIAKEASRTTKLSKVIHIFHRFVWRIVGSLECKKKAKS